MGKKKQGLPEASLEKPQVTAGLRNSALHSLFSNPGLFVYVLGTHKHVELPLAQPNHAPSGGKSSPGIFSRVFSSPAWRCCSQDFLQRRGCPTHWPEASTQSATFQGSESLRCLCLGKGCTASPACCEAVSSAGQKKDPYLENCYQAVTDKTEPGGQVDSVPPLSFFRLNT